jgi:hypothetical protein
MDLWVLIYSKFSKSCQELLTILDQNDIGIDFNLLSIDDKSMRTRIMKDKRFNIQFVPCILNVNQLSGVVSQYEADKAFELVYTQLQMDETQEVEYEPKSQEIPIEQQLHIESQYIPPTPQPASTSEHGQTAISDLIDEEEEEQEEEYIKKPLMPERQEPGNSIKKRINVSEVMSKSKKEVQQEPQSLARPSYNSAGIDVTKGPPEPIKSVKSGAPISVAEIMAQTAKDNKN